MTAFPCSVEALDAEWLSGVLGADVLGFDHRPVGTGLIGSGYSLDVTTPAGPVRLFTKFPTPDVAARSLLAGAYRSEVLFYREIAESVAISTPSCFAAEVSEDGTEFVLVLEDLHPGVQGDQIAGCGPDDARLAVVNLAGLHGPTWCDPALPAWLHRNGPDDAAVLAEVYAQAVETFVERYARELSAADATVLRSLPDQVAAWILARDERFAVVHGDYRLDNLVYAPGRVSAVDWQTLSVGLPGRDLAFFLGTCLEPELRRRHEAELVEAYHRALLEHGVADFTLEACRDDYVFSLPQGPLIAVLGAVFGSRTDRGDAMFLAMVRRSCAALRDHGLPG